MSISSRPRVLVSNDDGIHAPGINTLADALEQHFEVWVVAPDREQSARSHALTLHRPLRLIQHAERRFAVDGTPADSVYLAINHVLKGQVDLVVSGINHGANLGDDVAYSGTVSAAREAVFMHHTAFAISQVGPSPYDFQPAAQIAVQLAHRLLESSLKKRTFLNVNVPPRCDLNTASVVLTQLGHRRYDYVVEEKLDPRGKSYFWIGGPELDFQPMPGSDSDAIQRGDVSITPLATDLTDTGSLTELRWIQDLLPSRPAAT